MAKLARRAEKDLNALPEPLAVKAREIIRRLDQEPHLGKKTGRTPSRQAFYPPWAVASNHLHGKRRPGHRADDFTQKGCLPLMPSGPTELTKGTGCSPTPKMPLATRRRRGCR